MRALIALALAACAPGTAHVTGTFDTNVADTDTTPTVSPTPTCADPERRVESVFDLVRLQGRRDTSAQGAIVADLDGDQTLEILLPGAEPTAFSVEARGGLDLRPDLVVDAMVGAIGGSAADVDGDGDLDVFLARLGAPNALLRNDGGTLVDTGDPAPSARAHATRAGAWGDLDRDGDLDLLVANYGTSRDPSSPAEPNLLLINRGDGTFDERPDWLPVDATRGHTIAAVWRDLDNDGWVDLYVVNDVLAPESEGNRLFWNRGGRLVPDEGASGLDIRLKATGVALADLNDDLLLDVFVPGIDANRLLLSGESGWVDESGLWGLQPVPPRRVAWGGSLADLDNDGDDDVVLPYGGLSEPGPLSGAQPDALWLNEGTLFDEVSDDWGAADEGRGRAGLVVDLNRDGWPDLLKRDIDGPTLVHMARCGEAAWLRVHLEGPAGNPLGVGSSVMATGARDRLLRTVHAGGSGLSSGGPPEVHFGLRDAERVDLEVRWPDGTRSEARDVPTRRAVTISYGLDGAR